MVSADEVLAAAQTLPASECAWLIHALWDTLESKDWPPRSEDWIAEIRKRSELLDRGQMAVLSWPEVREQSRRQAGFDG